MNNLLNTSDIAICGSLNLVFDSLEYSIFLPLVLAVYYCLRCKWQNIWLLLASYVFYGWWDWRFLLLILVSTTVDFICGIKISETEPNVRKAFLALSMVTNLGILFFFKYFNFFIDSANALLSQIGFTCFSPALDVILPVGISFYTFQTMSYSIDIYRGNIQATRDPLLFALFVCYFPQLVAGPIERASQLLPALDCKRSVDYQKLSEGIFLISFGIFKKVGIANAISGTVDVIFSSPDQFSGLTLLIGVYFFALQIYCDFSGYSDIARGTSKLLGIDLMVNFNQPYFAASITEFWRRWHISLSGWLRDYLYIPLGGNRRGKLRTYSNLMLTMLIGGLWHGAAWTFVLWGVLHGFALAIEKALGVDPNKQPKFLYRTLRVIITFNIVCLSWIFFRAATFADAAVIIQGIARWEDGQFWIGEFEFARFITLAAFLMLTEIVQIRTANHAGLLTARFSLKYLMLSIMFGLLLILGGLNEDVPFIYFQF